MRNLPKLTAIILFTAILLLSLPLSASASKTMKVELVADGVDCKTDNGNVFVYLNKSETVRAIKADEYNFDPTKLMVFNKEGTLIECGGNLYVNTPEKSNSPQEYLYIPSNGFAIAFKDGANNRLKACFNTAMEGAKLYNATMSVIYPVTGSFDEATKTLSIEFLPNLKPSENATKFLFVGNSSTYFNGTPLKFKALASAAGKEVDVTYCTFGAAYLSEFADETHKNGIALRTALNSKKYDYVVLQDAGSATYNESKPAVEKLLPLIQENGATALLYMRYSGEKIPENRKDSAKVHYDNYNQLAKDFNLTVAPAAESFFICNEKYPDINLYADDNAHHSKEASYLIACIWLYQYLGIDPRGNEYKADMDDEIVKALQECAYYTCEVGYFNPKEIPVESSEESIETSSQANNENDESDESNITLYIIIGVIVVIIGCVVFLLISKKRKGLKQ